MVYSYFPQLLPISLVYLPLSHIFTMAVATVFYSSKIKQCEAENGNTSLRVKLHFCLDG